MFLIHVHNAERLSNPTMPIEGPYVDGAFVNEPGETLILCIDCANDRGVDVENAIMYSYMSHMNFMVCDDCGDVVRDNT